MSVWVDIIKLYDYFGMNMPGTSVKEEHALTFPMTYISVFYDSLPSSSPKRIKEEIDRFNFSDYFDAGYSDLNNLDVLRQNMGNYDLVIKNTYVDVKPFRLKVYHNDKIYMPNIKFINCVLNRFNVLNNTQYFSDENCVYNWI